MPKIPAYFVAAENPNSQLRPPGHITELMGRLHKWIVRRQAKGLDTQDLETVQWYLSEYRALINQVETGAEQPWQLPRR